MRRRAEFAFACQVLVKTYAATVYGEVAEDLDFPVLERISPFPRSAYLFMPIRWKSLMCEFPRFEFLKCNSLGCGSASPPNPNPSKSSFDKGFSMKGLAWDARITITKVFCNR